MKRKISTNEGIIIVEQIGRLHKIFGYYYFKHVSDSGIGIHITELLTGFAVPRSNTFAGAERFLKMQPNQKREQAMENAIKEIGNREIPFPLNDR